MELIGVPDVHGRVQFWINADHLVSVQQLIRHGEHGFVLEAELKVDGMPLHRVPLGEHPGTDDAEAVFHQFLSRLQTPHSDR